MKQEDTRPVVVVSRPVNNKGFHKMNALFGKYLDKDDEEKGINRKEAKKRKITSRLLPIFNNKKHNEKKLRNETQTNRKIETDSNIEKLKNNKISFNNRFSDTAKLLVKSNHASFRRTFSTVHRQRHLLIGFLFFLMLVLAPNVFAEEQLISLQGKITDTNGNLLESGNVTVTIWDAATGGSLIYNSSTNFTNNISNGFFDITLGSIADGELELNLSQTYYMDLQINEEDIDWDEAERRIFQSPVGYGMSGHENFTVDTNILYVDTTNNRVGIGTISPNDALEVVGNIRVSEGLNASSVNVTDRIKINSDGSAIGASGSLTFGVGEDGALYSDGTTAILDVATGLLLRTAGTGRIVMNTAALYPATSDGMTLGVANTFEWADLYLANGGTINWNSGDVIMTHAADTLAVTGGNVGIGTTAPAEEFVVIGNANISGTLNVSGRISFPNLASCDTIDTDANGVLTCGTDSTTGGGAVSGAGNSGNISYWNGENTQGNSTLFDNGGNIGIGTTAPAVEFVVIGQVNISDSLNVSGTVEAGNFVGDGSTLTGVDTSSTNELQNLWETISTDSGSVAADSNTDTLTIAGGADISTSRSGDTITVAFTGASPGTANSTFWNHSGGDVFLNDITGNVGIGTSNPGSKLTVIGDVNITGSLNVSANITFPGLANCDTIDTDANGVLTCGTDSGGGGEFSNFQLSNVTDNAITFRNASYINGSSSFGGEVTGTYENLAINNDALDDQYVLQENTSIATANATTTNFQIIEWNSSCTGFRYGTGGGVLLSCTS